MSNLIEFLFTTVIGIAVLAIFCRMIFNLYKMYRSPSSYFDGEVQPSKPWPRKTCNCNSVCPSDFNCLAEALRQSCGSDKCNSNIVSCYVDFYVNKHLEIKNKNKPAGPPNTKLNGDPLDKKAVKP